MNDLNRDPNESSWQQSETTPSPILSERITIQFCEFNDVLPLWSELWPERKSKIEPLSALKRTGGYDLNYFNQKVWFVCARLSIQVAENEQGVPPLQHSTMNEVIGVSSGHLTEPHEFRIRGTYVRPEYQHRGVGQKFIQQLIGVAQAENCELIWTLPRMNSLKFYEACGFEKVTDWSNEFEFGPNCVAVKTL